MHSVVPLQPQSHESITVYDPTNIHHLATAWLMSLRSPETRKVYGRAFKKFSTYCQLSQIDVVTARRVHIDGWRIHLEHESAPRTINGALSAVKSFYRYCISEHLRKDNPVDEVVRPKITGLAAGEVYLDDRQTALYMHAADISPSRNRLRTRAAAGLMFWCGLRVSEVVAIDGEHFGRYEDMRVVSIHGKGGAVETVKVPEQAWHRVRDYLLYRDWPTGPVFLDRSGKRMTRQAMSDQITRVAKMVPELVEVADRVRPHVFRRSAITSLSAKGVPLHWQQDFARHASADTTRGYDMGRKSLQTYAGDKLSLPQIDTDPVPHQRDETDHGPHRDE